MLLPYEKKPREKKRLLTTYHVQVLCSSYLSMCSGSLVEILKTEDKLKNTSRKREFITGPHWPSGVVKLASDQRSLPLCGFVFHKCQW